MSMPQLSTIDLAIERTLNRRTEIKLKIEANCLNGETRPQLRQIDLRREDAILAQLLLTKRKLEV